MIYLECYPDKVLVNSLGIPKKEIKHASNKGNICNKLEKNRNSKGLVDEDPNSSQPTYIKKLKPYTEEAHIKVLYDENNQNYLIILQPTLEEWILKVTKEAKIDISKYNLPQDAKELHKIINIKLPIFKELIEEIKQSSKMLKILERFIKM